MGCTNMVDITESRLKTGVSFQFSSYVVVFSSKELILMTQMFNETSYWEETFVVNSAYIC